MTDGWSRPATSSMKRLMLTLVAMASLWAVYRVYARIMAPLTATKPGSGQQQTPEAFSPLEPLAPVHPPDFAQFDRHLTDAEWTRSANYKIRNGENAFLYFNQYETRGARVDVTPFAMVWFDERRGRSAVPYVFLCESARITFEREFVIGGESPGRLTAAALDGAVRITGPDGLVIEGHDCVFAEDGHQIYSDRHLTFRYRPSSGQVRLVRGEADQLQIDLIPSTYPVLGRDMPRVSGLERLTLRRNVVIDFIYDEFGYTQRTRVESKGPFSYDFTQKLATFQEGVVIDRPIKLSDGPPLRDRLLCHILGIQFHERAEPLSAEGGDLQLIGGEAAADASEPEDDDPGSPLRNLEFQMLHAIGNGQTPVEVSSQRSRFAGSMHDLVYHAQDRALYLQDPQKGVRLDHDGSQLHCTGLRITHDEKGELHFVESLRGGRLDHTSPGTEGRPPLSFYALWDRRMTMQPNPETGETLVVLEGGANVVQPGEQGIAADRLSLWVASEDLETFASSETPAATSPAVPDAQATPAATTDAAAAATAPASLEKLPLRRVLAEGNVALAGRQFAARTSRFDVYFRSGPLPRRTVGQSRLPVSQPAAALAPGEAESPAQAIGCGDEAAASTSDSDISSCDGGSEPPPPSPGNVGPGAGAAGAPAAVPPARTEPRRNSLAGRLDGTPWYLSASTLTAIVYHDPETGAVDVAEFVGEGKVHVTQALPPQAGIPPQPAGADSISVTGNRLHLLNEGDVEQTLYLTGEPAHLRREGLHIEGDELLFDRAANAARVIGKGLMQLPVNSSPTGEALSSPTQLDIRWQREMTFDGRLARFIEKVLARLEDSVMQCDEMHVTLNRRIDFTSDNPDTADVTIQTVTCLRGVELQYLQWQDQTLLSLINGRGTQLQLRYDTGDFEVQGSGQIQGWQLGNESRVEVEPGAVARANQPVAAESLPWQYTEVRFAGKITGNMHKQTGTLHDRVRVIHAPVANVRQVFVRDDLSKGTESARNAVYLGCDELQITMHPSDGPERDYVQLLAVGKLARVELEGRLFQANADTLSYDESKKLFTLRGLGANKASVSHQERPGAPYQDVRAQTIQFNPARRAGAVQGSDGAFGFTP